MTEITECSICSDTYVDPRILPCMHIFCLRCLQETAKSSSVGPGGTMPCPFCSSDFIVPKEGMIGLQKDFFMDRLVELAKISKPPEGSILCEICFNGSEGKGAETPRASMYCMQCHQRICNLCCDYHKKFKEYKDHQIVPLGHKVEEELISKSFAEYCDKHSRKRVEVYCADCKDAICIMCLAETHQGHKCSDIEKGAESFRKKIKTIIERTKSFSNDTQSESEKIIEAESEFLKKIEVTESAILKRGKALKDLIDKSTQSLLDELMTLKQSWMKTMQSEKERKDLHKEIIDSFEKYCSELKAKGSAKEICRSVVDINSRVSEIQQLHEGQSLIRVTPVEIFFEDSKIEDLLEKENIVGKLKGSSTKYQQKLKKLITSDMMNSVCGLALLENRLFVTTKFYNAVFVYDHLSLKRMNTLELEPNFKPSDIVSYSQKNCLYIVSSGSLSIVCIDPKGRKLRQWKLSFEPHNMSTTRSGNIMLTSNGRITEYSADGRELRNLALDKNDFYMSWHTILLNSGDFLVCQGCWDFSKQHRILTCDSKGNITRSYGVKGNSSPGQLLNPVYMATDNDDWVFVADSGNNRVVLLDEKLNFVMDILTKKDGIIEPYRLLLDEASGVLYVGTNDKKLHLFQIGKK